MAALGFIIYSAAILTEAAAAPWTLDLPEARRQIFDAHGKKDENFSGKVENSTEEFNVLYSNYNPNSKYNDQTESNRPQFGIGYDDEVEFVRDDQADGPDMGRYAEEYEYQSYMEKKVTKLVHNGSKYLEGLRGALEQYYQSLEECDRMNFTMNSTSNNQMEIPSTIPANLTNLPFTQNSTDQILTLEKCKNLTEKSEQIRRVAHLALHTTKMLQERVYTQKYDQPDEEYDIEDRSLIIRLAWFLDKLAELTGYDANVNERLTTTSQAPPTLSTALATMPSLSEVPEDIKLAMLECLKNKQNSPDPATVRCNFPVTYPAFMQQLFNVSDDATAQPSDALPTSVTYDELERIYSDTETDFTDISEIYDHNLKEEFPPKTSPVKPHLPPKVTATKHVQKRSLPESDPFNNIVNYYAKYKAWTNVNPEAKSAVIKSEIHNGNAIEKRSLQHYLKNPEDFQDVEFYVNHKEILDTDKKTSEVKQSERNKRSAHRIEYYKKKIMPRLPQDSITKLDFYYKNKEGTDVRADPVQAAQVRAGLERIFQTGNIEVIRRYGSNYNPAVQNQLVAGLAPSLVDLFV